MFSILVVSLCAFGDPVTIRTVDDLQSRIAHRNNQLSTLSWHCEYKNGSLDNGRFVPGKEISYSDVTAEPATGRCRLHIQSLKRAPDDSPYYGERQILAFDGKRAQYYLRQKAGDSIPTANPGDGIEDIERPDIATIRPDINPANLEGTRSGLAFVLGNTYSGALDYIVARAKTEPGTVIGIERLQEGPIYRFRVENDKTYALHDYDTEKQCFVNFELHRKGSTKSLIKKADIELTQIDGIWLPTKVITRTPFDKFAQQLTYTKWKVNEPVPDSRFALPFPKGSRVEDHVEKKIYVVGGSPVDEAKAIRDYMSSFHIQEPAPKWNNRKWVIGVGAALLLGASLFTLIRFRRGIAILLLLAVGSQANADEAATQHRLECGFQVTVAVLEYHRIKYDPSVISRNLMADSRNGVSLAKIKDILDAHGMETSARNGLSRDDGKRAVQAGWLAIVPAEAKSTCTRPELAPTAGKPNHYFLLWNSPSEGVMVVDIMHPPVPLTKSELTDTTFKDRNSAILFVRRRQS